MSERAAGDVDAWLLGQVGERRVVATGWIGEHPATGRDVAHLMLYPEGHGAADKMRRVADVFDLGGHGLMGDVPPNTLRATLGDAPEGLSVWLHTTTTQGLLHRPVTEEWAQAARAQRMVVLTVSLAPLMKRPGRDPIAEIDRHLRRPQRFRMGIVQLVAE